MNIGIDHGYSAIKTRHFSFPAGISLYSSEPYTLQNTLEFEGKFHVCGTGRQPILRDKTENDNYYVPIRNKLHEGEIELVVFADDAAKVQRVLDNLNLDFVRAQAGEAVAPVPAQETSDPAAQAPEHGETGNQEIAGNFTNGRVRESGEAVEKNPSAPSSSSRSRSPGSENSERPSVRKALQEIRREQAAKHRPSELDRQISPPRRTKKREKTRG